MTVSKDQRVVLTGWMRLALFIPVPLGRGPFQPPPSRTGIMYIQRSDVDFQSALAQAFSGSPTASQIAQISFQPQTDSTGAMQVDGNGVDINTEMADMSENTLDYQALESVLATRMSILKTAIGTTS